METPERQAEYQRMLCSEWGRRPILDNFILYEAQAARVAELEKELAKARLDLHKAALDLDGSMQRERHLNRYIDNLTA